LTKEEIIQGCRAKKAVYQKALVDRYAPMLLSVCRRYAKNSGEAEDVLQESLIRIFKYFDKYEESRGSFETWMCAITVNTALKYFDKNCFKKQILDLSDMENLQVHPRALSSLQAEDLMHLVQNLPEGYRQVFNLFAIEGYSHKEISKKLGIAESASRSNLSRARGLLKAAISESGTGR
jgi:RNA polymerase sigma factor (sigma-70 family)